MVYSPSMKFRLAMTIALGFAADGSMAQSKPSDAKQRPPTESRKAPKPEAAEAKSGHSGNSARQPVTLTQVERVTGGQVIGARKIMVQGRRLNQIKLKMPDGRVIIYSRLFDEFGRSVDTVESIEVVDEPETRSAKQ